LARIQLCGRLVVELGGSRVEDRLPGRQGRLLFVFLAVNRLRSLTRDELVAALWPDGRDGGLAPLLSKLRRVVPLSGRSEVRLALPTDVWIDLEAAREAVHRAESAVARGDWAEAWAPARVAIHTGARGFLPGEDAPWVDAVRRELEDVRVRGLEAAAEAGLALGGAELAGAKRSARTLVELEPYRESGYRYLMQALAREGNRAEALALYERLRILLRDELGAAPAPETQALHRSLLG
jgi:DNA-binding SARP family transcriptional activator